MLSDFFIKKYGHIQEEFSSVALLLQTKLQHMQIFKQIYKNKARTILFEKQKNKYDPKIKMVKYLEPIN